ncbi:tol-pal system protein YbgF [Halothiobacillus sp. DCM-1]|uniref:tol-pal system protein YbgF n=1 Tax=Halothiobacillus sp. DCM-1 TaxID=3112558 RepID=UPI00324E3A2C
MRNVKSVISGLGAIIAAALPVNAVLANPPNWLGWNEGSTPAQQAAPANTQGGAQTTPLQPAVPQPLGATDAAPSPGSGQSVVMQNLLDSVSRLQEQVRDLRGQVEEQGNELKQLKKSQQAGFANFDDRINQLSQGASSSGAAPAAAGAPAAAPSSATPPPVAPSPGQSPTTAPPPVPTAPSPPAGAISNAPSAAASGGGQVAASQQQNLYNAAFNLLKDGKYDQAIAGFQSAIDADPKGQWTPSALFWQGETYYVQQKRAQADKAYQQVLTEFPKSDRVPDALLKTGYIAYDENKNAQARAIFQKVIDQYPQSQAANLAKQRLARMAAEKR